MKFKGYDFKNVPTSTGRADVIARFISSALLEPAGLNKDVGVVIFFNDIFYSELNDFIKEKGNNGNPSVNLEKFGVLITEKSQFFSEKENNKEKFDTEHSMLVALYKSLENVTKSENNDSIFHQILKMNYNEFIKELLNSSRKSYILIEDATIDINTQNFNLVNDLNSKFKDNEIAFIIGDQIGFGNEPILGDKRINRIKIGKEAMLASSVVNFIKYQIYKQ